MVFQRAHSTMGEQYHINHPSPLTDQLYLSAARAISSRVLLDLGITCIINATLELPTMAYQEQDCLQVAVEDHVASKLYVYFDLVADKIKSVHDSASGKAMIYCRAGMSRSASLCIAYFIKYHDMTLDDAFQYVKQRRPIIQPNVGFMRQLREFEQKIRKSKSGSASGGGGKMPRTPSWKRKQREVKLPALKIAECCSSEEKVHYDDYYSIKIIKPHHARRPKVNVCDENNVFLPAQSFAVGALAEICLEMPAEVSAATATRHDGEELLCLLSPSASAPPTIVVAEVHCPTALEAAGEVEGHGADADRESRPKTPFARIAEPAKIAVSWMPVLAEEASEMSTIGNRPLTHVSSSPASISVQLPAELQLRGVPTVARPVALDCLGGGADQALAGDASSFSYCKARTVVAPPLHHSDDCQLQIFEEEGLFRKEKLDESTQINTPAPAAKKPHIPRSAPPPLPPPDRKMVRQRSILLPGLRISYLPNKTKLDDVVEEDANYLEVCQASEPPLPFLCCDDSEEIPAIPFQRLSPSMEQVDASRCCCAQMRDELVSFEIGVKDATLKFRLWTVATIAMRSAVPCRDYVVTTVDEILWDNDIVPPDKLMPQRMFPYYSISKGNEEAKSLSRALEQPNVEVSWYFALTPKRASKTVCLVNKRSTVCSLQTEQITMEKTYRKHGRHWKDPQINWAAERYHIDLNSSPQTCKPMEDVECGRATPSSDGREAKHVAAVQDDAMFVCVGSSRIKKFEPQCYSAHHVASVCCATTYGVAEHDTQRACLMENMFCQPTVFKSVGTRSQHADDQLVVISQQITEEVSDDSKHYEIIPEVNAGNLGELKRRMLLLNNSDKVSIWLDVFKRAVIRSRPLHAKISVAEPLATAEQTAVEHFGEIDAGYLQMRSQERVVDGCDVVCHLPLLVDDHVSEECVQDLDEEHADAKDVMAKIHVDEHWSAGESVEESALEDLFIMSTSSRSNTCLRFKIFPRIEEPRCHLANAEETHLLGLEGRLQAQVPLEWMARRPFSILAPMMAVGDLGCDLVLVDNEPNLSAVQAEAPEFVSRVSSHEGDGDAAEEVEAVTEVDLLWFFEANPEQMRGLTPLPAEAAAATARSGNFQLFLPDPSLVDRLGTATDEFAPEPRNDVSEVAASGRKIVESLAVNINASRSRSRSRPRSRQQAKKVSFQQQQQQQRQQSHLSPSSSSARIPSTKRKAVPSSYVSYQTPRNRSSSSRRKDDSGLDPDSRCRENRQALATLKTSVRTASGILERRRRAEDSEDGAAGSRVAAGLFGAANQLSAPVAASPPSTSTSSSRSSLRRAARERTAARRSGWT